MFFYVQGPNQHDLMPLESVFDKKSQAGKRNRS